MICLIKTVPNPINKLKRGPAIDPAIPISPYPALANAQFKLKSGAELPVESKVIPRNACGILNITPSALIISIIFLDMNHIQDIDIIKEQTLIIVIYLGRL
jgi:hypothetical protein